MFVTKQSCYIIVDNIPYVLLFIPHDLFYNWKLYSLTPFACSADLPILLPSGHQFCFLYL